MSLYLPCLPFYLPFFCLPINHVCCLYTIFSVYPSCYTCVSIFTMFFCLFNMFIYLSTMFACLYTIFLSTHQVTILVFIFSIFSVYLPPLLVYLSSLLVYLPKCVCLSSMFVYQGIIFSFCPLAPRSMCDSLS